uniref:(northern house mosquito) hypothetical protein n=1 Tax=Culex pipiens TaxID=7175 RepID=A0A8D8A6V3_CULPI
MQTSSSWCVSAEFAPWPRSRQPIINLNRGPERTAHGNGFIWIMQVHLTACTTWLLWTPSRSGQRSSRRARPRQPLPFVSFLRCSQDSAFRRLSSRTTEVNSAVGNSRKCVINSESYTYAQHPITRNRMDKPRDLSTPSSGR